MKKISALLCSLALLACQSEKKDNKSTDSSAIKAPVINVAGRDTLTFKYDSVKVYSKNPVSSNKNITDTAKATVIFPVFKNSAINQEIQKIALAPNSPDDPIPKSYKELTSNFINAFDKYKAEVKDDQQNWFLHTQIQVLPQRSNYLGFRYDFKNFTGGAHGSYSRIYLNYDLKNKQVITLDSLLKPGSKVKLTTIAEEIFRKQEGLSSTQTLKDDYFFDKDLFALNSNFTITSEGLLFVYNPYEIKAYAAGITELLIPFDRIKDLLKPNPVLPALK
jgi:hypothetical protein